MTIAIVIATHGEAAEQLVKTAEMLIGEQDDLAYIDFLPGENADTLVTKYQAKLDNELSHCNEVLFLVDMWGGSPFNAANRLVADQPNRDVVAGVNIPMLINTCMARDEVENLEQLVNIALESGLTGIKALNYQPKEKPTTLTPEQIQPQPQATPTIVDNGKRMTIALARIDDRLVHGQVATRWTKESRVSRIIVVNDDVAKDTVRTTMLKNVAPLGVTVHVVNVDKMVRVYNNPEYGDDRVMLLFTNPTDVVTLLKAGVNMASINIGGVSYTEGKKMITSAVAVDETDIVAYKEIDAMGIELDVRKVSNDSRQYMMDLLKKNNLI